MVMLIVEKGLTHEKFMDHDDVSDEAKDHTDEIFELAEEREDIGAIAFDEKYSEVMQEGEKIDVAPPWDGKVPGHLKNAKGHFVPEEAISEYDKEKEKLFDEVETIFGDIELSLSTFRDEIDEKVTEFVKKAEAEFGKEIGGQLSVSLSNFAGNMKVERKTIAESTSFYLKKRDKENKFKSVKTSLN